VVDKSPLNKEKWVADEIRRRITEFNLNAIAIWVGPTGTGKSYSALRLAELVDDRFTLKHLVFSADNFLDLINVNRNEDDSGSEGIEPGQVLVWDEAGLGMPAREWQSIFNRSVGYVLQSFRFKRIALFMTVPDQAFIDAQARALFHYYFECVAIDRMNKWVIAKPFITEHSPRFGKDYMKYPRIRLSTGTVKMGTVQFALPSSNLRESYEEKRRKYMDAYYRDLRDSLVMGAAQGGDVPIWAWRAIVDLRSRLASDTELAGVLQVSREWTNKLLARARVALKRPA